MRLAVLDKIEFPEKLERVLYRNEHGAFDFAGERFDIGSFSASLTKKIETLQRVLAKSSQRLENENFLNCAPAETVAEEKEKHTHITRQLNRLKELQNAFL
jgi:valyl-tRNA synthetase